MKLPSTTELALLCALGAREVSGRELAKRYEKDNERTISYGTLYTTMRRLAEGGWVTVREAEDGDRRVRYFKLSSDATSLLPKLRGLNAVVSGLEVLS